METEKLLCKLLKTEVSRGENSSLKQQQVAFFCISIFLFKWPSHFQMRSLSHPLPLPFLPGRLRDIFSMRGYNASYAKLHFFVFTQLVGRVYSFHVCLWDTPFLSCIHQVYHRGVANFWRVFTFFEGKGGGGKVTGPDGSTGGMPVFFRCH